MEKTYNEEEVIQMVQTAFAHNPRAQGPIEAIKNILENPWLTTATTLARIQRVLDKVASSVILT